MDHTRGVEKDHSMDEFQARIEYAENTEGLIMHTGTVRTFTEYTSFPLVAKMISHSIVQSHKILLQ
jgi:hypothetical protein